MPARKSFLEAPDADKPCEASWQEETRNGQRRINKRTTIRLQRNTSTVSSTPGVSRTVTRITFTQSGSRPAFERDVNLDRILKSKASTTFGIGSQSTGMLTLLGQHFPGLLSDGAFKRELERGRSRESHSMLRSRKSSGAYQAMQENRSEGRRSIGRRHREYYTSSWRSTSSGCRRDPSNSVISLKRTSPAGIDFIEASVQSRIPRPEHERLDPEHPEIPLETAKDESSFASEDMLPLTCGEGAETDPTLSSGDDDMIEQYSKRPRTKLDVPYQSYVEDDADEERG